MKGENIHNFLCRNLLVSMLLSFSITGLSQTSGKKLNILWITCEDMSASLPMYGDSTIRTPNLSRLTAEGVKFTKMYSVAGVCAPSRSSIITGMYPPGIGTHHMRTSGAGLKDSVISAYEAVPPSYVKCFPEYLRAAGYYCTNNLKTDYQIGNPFTVWDESSNRAHWRNRPEGKPFFSVINITDTHESRIWANADKPLRVDPRRVSLPPYYPESLIIRKDVARYYDNIMRMDSIVGDILKQLDEDGLRENTIVFFFSDHGAGLPWYKRELYERGLHVPMIIRFPSGDKAGTTDTQLLSFMDLAPTVLSLANVPVPKHMQGKAFLGKQKTQTTQKYIYAARDRMDEHYDMARAVRDKRFRYVRNYQPDKVNYMPLVYRERMEMMKEILRLRDEGKLNVTQQRWFQIKPAEELYDVDKDPFELNNLATDPAYKNKLEELRMVQNNWSIATRDKGFMMEKDMIKQMWPEGKQPLTAKPEIQIIKESGNVTTIKLSSPTEGASIGYKIGGRTGQWLLYTTPINLRKGQQLFAKSIRYGYKESIESIYKN